MQFHDKLIFDRRASIKLAQQLLLVISSIFSLQPALIAVILEPNLNFKTNNNDQIVHPTTVYGKSSR